MIDCKVHFYECLNICIMSRACTVSLLLLILILFSSLRAGLHGGRGGAHGSVLQGDLQGLPRGQVPAEHPGPRLLVPEHEAGHHQAPHLSGDSAHLMDILPLLD